MRSLGYENIRFKVSNWKTVQLFCTLFEIFSAQTAETLFLLVLSMLAMESADSIRSMYRHFLSGITKKSLNAFYYACSYAKANYSKFAQSTAAIALKLIPDFLELQPVFLCIDDTIASKFGVKFENVSKLFDNAAHNGSHYLNGHCFVSTMLYVPVWNGNKINYLSVPLEYRMWQKRIKAVSGCFNDYKHHACAFHETQCHPFVRQLVYKKITPLSG